MKVVRVRSETLGVSEAKKGRALNAMLKNLAALWRVDMERAWLGSRRGSCQSYISENSKHKGDPEERLSRWQKPSWT